MWGVIGLWIATDVMGGNVKTQESPGRIEENRGRRCQNVQAEEGIRKGSSERWEGRWRELDLQGQGEFENRRSSRPGALAFLWTLLLLS